jgi:pyrroline-5-carboxylate reductase
MLEGETMQKKQIFFAGAGSMSEAMIKGIVAAQVVPGKQIVVSNRKNEAKLLELSERYGVQVSRDKRADIERADIVILAMKPFDVMAALLEIGAALTKKKLVISVVAGVMTSTIEGRVEAEVPVIRAMPNTSSYVQASATAISRGRWAAEEQMEQARRLFEAVGSVEVVEERLLDAVTGLSATGPAYFYYMLESLMKAGQREGLPEETCRELLVQTMYGAAKMVRETGKTPGELRRQVTSPNGTTMAAMNVLEKGGFQELVERAVEHATRRAGEMGRETNM